MPLLVLLAWEAFCRAGLVSPIMLPAPTAIAVKWFAWFQSGELFEDMGGSLYRVIAGFLLGASLALPLGLFMGSSPRVYDYFNPVIQVLRPIPPIAWIPMSILWFGLGNPPAIFLISLGAFSRY